MNSIDKQQQDLLSKIASTTKEEEKVIENETAIKIKGKLTKIKDSKIGNLVVDKYLYLITGIKAFGRGTKNELVRWNRYRKNIMALIGDFTLATFFSIADKGWNKLKQLFQSVMNKAKSYMDYTKGLMSGVNKEIKQYRDIDKEERKQYRKDMVGDIIDSFRRGMTEEEAREKFFASKEYKNAKATGDYLSFVEWAKAMKIKIKGSPRTTVGKVLKVTRAIDKKVAWFMTKGLVKNTWRAIKWGTRGLITYMGLWARGTFEVSKQVGLTMLHMGSTPAEAMTASLLAKIDKGIEFLAGKDDYVKEQESTNKRMIRGNVSGKIVSGIKSILGKIFGKKTKRKEITDPSILTDIENKATRLYYEYLQAGRTPEEASRAADAHKQYLLDIAIAQLNQPEEPEKEERKNSWLNRMKLWGKKDDGKDSNNKDKTGFGKVAKGLGLTGGLIGIGFLLNKMGFGISDIATGVNKVIDVVKTVGTGIGKIFDGVMWVVDKLGVIGTLLAAGAVTGGSRALLDRLMNGPVGGAPGKTASKVGGFLRTAKNFIPRGKLGKAALVGGIAYGVGSLFGEDEKSQTDIQQEQINKINNNQPEEEMKAPGENGEKLSTADVVTGAAIGGMNAAAAVSLASEAKSAVTKSKSVLKNAGGKEADLIAKMSKAESTAGKAKIFLKEGMGFIDKLKATIVKKLGPKAAVKVLGKIASKFIPIIGWVSLLWSIGEFFKLLLVDKKPFLNSLSIAFTGIDFFGPDDEMIDPETGEKLKTIKDEKNEIKQMENMQNYAYNSITKNKLLDNKNNNVTKKYILNGKEVSEEEYNNDPIVRRMKDRKEKDLSKKQAFVNALSDNNKKVKEPTTKDKGSPSPYIKPLKDSSPGGVADVTGLQPEVQQRLHLLGKEYFDRYGKKLEVTSAYRDPNHQAKLWEQAYGFYPTGNIAADRANPLYAKSSKRGKVGHPSTSRHKDGLAFDINMAAWDQVKSGSKISADRRDPEVDDLLAKYGFNRPYTGFNGYKGFKERWHVGLLGNRQPVESNEPDDTVQRPADEKKEVQQEIKDETKVASKDQSGPKKEEKGFFSSIGNFFKDDEEVKVVDNTQTKPQQATFTNTSNNVKPASMKTSIPVSKPEIPKIDFSSVNSLLAEGNADRKLILTTLQTIATTISVNMNNANSKPENSLKDLPKQSPKPEMRIIDDQSLINIKRKTFKV
ncbi:M15 family metallopeptidase [Campylobacter coli]